jgi:hypothetical protein
MAFHQGLERDVPHQEQTVSLLPMSFLQRGQSMALLAIKKTFPQMQLFKFTDPGYITLI